MHSHFHIQCKYTTFLRNNQKKFIVYLFVYANWIVRKIKKYESGFSE